MAVSIVLISRPPPNEVYDGEPDEEDFREENVVTGPESPKSEKTTAVSQTGLEAKSADTLSDIRDGSYTVSDFAFGKSKVRYELKAIAYCAYSFRFWQFTISILLCCFSTTFFGYSYKVYGE